MFDSFKFLTLNFNQKHTKLSLIFDQKPLRLTLNYNQKIRNKFNETHFQQEGNVIPIEVKSGEGRTLKSMQIFLESHPKSPYGIRFSVQNYSEYNKIHSYPLYAIFRLSTYDTTLSKAIESLI